LKGTTVGGLVQQSLPTAVGVPPLAYGTLRQKTAATSGKQGVVRHFEKLDI